MDKFGVRLNRLLACSPTREKNSSSACSDVFKNVQRNFRATTPVLNFNLLPFCFSGWNRRYGCRNPKTASCWPRSWTWEWTRSPCSRRGRLEPASPYPWTEYTRPTLISTTRTSTTTVSIWGYSTITISLIF